MIGLFVFCYKFLLASVTDKVYGVFSDVVGILISGVTKLLDEV